MNNLIKLLDKNLEYIEHEIIEDTIYISVKSIKEYICVSLNMSSIAASKYLSKNLANVGKSTICTLLKKRYNNT